MKDARLATLEEAFKAFADPTRLRILGLLAGGEICVCNIHECLGIPQPMASRHLAYLRRKGLVRTQKRRVVGALHARAARRARHACADERGDARALSLRCDHERSPTPGNTDRLLRAGAVRRRTFECCLPADLSAVAHDARRRKREAPKAASGAKIDVAREIDGYPYGVAPNATKTIQVKRCTGLAQFSRSRTPTRHEFLSVVSSARFQSVRTGEPADDRRTVSLPVHSFRETPKISITRRNREHKMQCALTSANQQVAVIAPRASEDGARERDKNGNEERLLKPKGAKPWQYPAHRRNIQRGTRSGPRATSSSPFLSSCRRKDSPRFCRR